jgi:hypothetical protein
LWPQAPAATFVALAVRASARARVALADLRSGRSAS